MGKLAVFPSKSHWNHGHCLQPVLHLFTLVLQIHDVGWEMRNQEVRGGHRGQTKAGRAGQDRKEGEGEEGAGWVPGS